MKINYIGYNFTHREKFKLNRPNGAVSNILINVKSPAEFVIGDKKMQVAPDTIVIIKKGTPHRYEYNDCYGTDDWFHFELSDEEEEYYNLPYDTVTHIDDATMISFLISKMQYEYYGQNTDRDRKIDLYFEMLWLEIKEKMEKHHSGRPHDFSIYNMRAYIYNYPSHRARNQYFANMVNMSLSHFQRTYEKIFGISPTKDMILSRVERTKYLLKNTNYSVNEIAMELNYKNDVQLIRQFKKITGMTPLEYRKKY